MANALNRKLRSTQRLAQILSWALGMLIFFSDYFSPLSDTTILSSLGAGSDHVDHVKTQMPYAMVVAVISMIGYFIIVLCL